MCWHCMLKHNLPLWGLVTVFDCYWWHHGKLVAVIFTVTGILLTKFPSHGKGGTH